MNLSLETGPNGINLIKAWEGIEDGDPTTVKLDPYLDPVGYPTIGWGHLIQDHEDFSGGITPEEAEELLRKDVKWAEQAISKNVDRAINQNQFDSLVCFVYNIGARAFIQSTLLEWLNKGRYNDIPQQFTRWNRAKGKSFLGLARRRVAESELFLRS